MPTENMPATLWIAACAHRLQQQWHSVDVVELEDMARVLWRDERLRAMWPEDAAADWLRPVMPSSADSAPNAALGVSNFSLTGKPSPAGRPVRGP
ncbi:hypothetical protein QTI51_03795 [Variovorax sp. J22G73]|jgi:hypothetical protein|uniref:hypothetical protein n=1 Tax=unclassified Variovorax TaxID=663243 RepID=UPI000D5CF77C|nr:MULTISPECIES: hypothetical protein [unclassified Variovorax]MDM0003950.1 hypothetical protein [Variovorax sp. J22R203]MDM0096384.1 hypothetical protein [Variovorax sp. J22G73]